MSTLSDFLDSLSGGGGGAPSGTVSGAVNTDIKAVAPPWADKWQNKTLPAFGPGQQNMLASQLAWGGFGGAPGAANQPARTTANNTWLNQLYSPAQSADFGPGIPPAPPGTAPGTTPPVGPSAAPFYTQANFPWQAYIASHPGIQQGPNATAGAEGVRAYQDWLTKNPTWRAPAASPTVNPPVNPPTGVVGPSAFRPDNSYAARRQRGETNQR